MIDINLIRENPEKVKELLKRKLWDADFTELLQWDAERKELIKEVEGNKAEMNRLSASVPQAKKNGEDVSKIFAKVKEIAKNNQENEQKLKDLEQKIYDFLIVLPNIPDEDLLGGGKENNKVIMNYTSLRVIPLVVVRKTVVTVKLKPFYLYVVRFLTLKKHKPRESLLMLKSVT